MWRTALLSFGLRTLALVMSETLLPQIEDPEARKALMEAVLALFDRWKLSERERLHLLGFSRMPLPKAGEPLPQNQLPMERIGHLLAIDRALHALYAEQPELCDQWIAMYPVALDGRRPLDLMLAEGVEGMRKVRLVIDHVATSFRVSDFGPKRHF